MNARKGYNAAMQAVILAAGRGTRMKDLTREKPKPLLEVAGKSLLEHKFDILPYDVDEVILVVGYLGGEIHQKFGGTYKEKRLLYVEQETLDGTAGALWKAQGILNDRFLVMMGDDIYSRRDADRCIETNGWSMLVQETPHMHQGGNVITDENGAITDIKEGDHEGKAGLVNTNMFVLDTRIFDYPLVPKSEGSSEYGLPQTILAASKQSGIPLEAVTASFWFQITDPEDLTEAEKFLQGKGESTL